MEITFDNVSLKDYELNNLSLKTPKKQIIGFIEINSENESLILKTINNDMVLSSGKISISKFPLDKYYKNIGFAYRYPNYFFYNQTVKEEIQNNLKQKKYEKEDSEKRIEKSLKLVGFDKKIIHRAPQTLNFCEQKKLSLAIALSHNPKIILLDEPSLGLDYKSKEDLIKLIRMMKIKYNKTILISSLDTDFLYSVVDYIYVLEDGSLIKEGDKVSVFKWIVKEKDNIKIPKLVDFSVFVKKVKKITLGYRDNLDDLAKDIYRNV